MSNISGMFGNPSTTSNPDDSSIITPKLEEYDSMYDRLDDLAPNQTDSRIFKITITE